MTTDVRRATHAQTYGFDDGAIKTITMDLKRLRNAAIPLDIKIGGIGLFSKRVSWEELGIPQADRRAQRLRRGKKDLFPHSLTGPLVSLEKQIRQNLVRYSYDVEGFKPYRVVPATAFQTWKEAHDRLVIAFEEKKRALLDGYDLTISAITADFTEIAREAYTAIRSRDGALAEDEESFIARIVADAVQSLPSRDDMRSSLVVELRTAIIEDDTDIAQRAAQQDQANLERARIRADEDQVRLMNQARQDIIRQQISTMINPIAETLRQFEARVYEDVAEMLETVKTQGYMPGRTAEKARGLMDLYRMMVIAQSPRADQLEKALGDLQAVLDVTKAKDPTQQFRYNPDSVKEMLLTLADLTHESAVGVNDAAQASEWSAIEIDEINQTGALPAMDESPILVNDGSASVEFGDF